MPRRSVKTASTRQTDQSSVQDSLVASRYKSLRTNWKWAAFSQFFFTFSDLLVANDVALSDIENDLCHETNIFLPRIMQRLLYTLTQDRKLNADNWQASLKRQYARRGLENRLLGFAPTPESSTHPSTPHPADAAEPHLSLPEADGLEQGPSVIANGDVQSPQQHLNHLAMQASDESGGAVTNWLNLPMLSKLDSLHTLLEWQFENPMRFRTVMKSDDELASWRIEPVAYDSKLNAYWLIGERLWIQRPLPKPPRLNKRKRSIAAKPSTPTANDIKKRKLTPAKEDSRPPLNGGLRGRAAKQQAKQKLTAQAKELAQFEQLAELQKRERKGFSSSPTKSSAIHTRPTGTRLSARLRGATDGWQEVPQEWLADDASKPRNGTRTGKTGLESDIDSMSDLTDLSDDDDKNNEDDVNSPDDEEASVPVLCIATVTTNPESEWSIPEDFVEWETVCITLEEWSHVGDQYVNATHYMDKAIYKFLVNEVVPQITANLREIERRQKLEAALSTRKRSNRIALKESEKEGARILAKQQAEEQERQERARRLEQSQKNLREKPRTDYRDIAPGLRRSGRISKDTRAESDTETANINIDIISDDATLLDGRGPATQQNGEEHLDNSSPLPPNLPTITTEPLEVDRPISTSHLPLPSSSISGDTSGHRTSIAQYRATIPNEQRRYDYLQDSATHHHSTIPIAYSGYATSPYLPHPPANDVSTQSRQYLQSGNFSQSNFHFAPQPEAIPAWQNRLVSDSYVRGENSDNRSGRHTPNYLYMVNGYHRPPP